MNGPTHDNARLTIVRRLYFYAVFVVSLVAALVACDQLIGVLSQIWLGDGLVVGSAGWARSAIAGSAGVLVVATPIFLFHWAYIRRRLDSPDELHAALRKFSLYLASAIALIYLLVYLYDLLSGIAFLAFGGSPEQSTILPSEWLHWTLMALIAGGLVRYLHGVLLQDGDYGNEEGVAGIWRRLYQTIAGLAGLLMLIFGSAGLIEVLLQALVELIQPAIGDSLWRAMGSHALAMVLVGAMLARINWRRWQAIIAAFPDEGKRGLRRLYLYAAVLISALTALTPSAMLLREVLLLLFGTGAGPMVKLLSDLTTPLAYVPVGIVAWLWYRRYLQREAERFGDSAESATVRRLYAYLVAAAALGLVWYGAVELIGPIIDWIFGAYGPQDPRQIWLDPLATGLSLFAVGIPVWVIHWRSVQAVARQDDRAGAAERASGPRRVYLYGIALISALFVLFYLAQVIYRLFLWLLGDPTAGILSAQTANDIARSIIALVIWLYHGWTIRADGQMADGVVAGESVEGTSVPVEDERAVLLARLARLEQELALVRQALAETDSSKQGCP